MKGKWFPILAAITLLAVAAAGVVLLRRAGSPPAQPRAAEPQDPAANAPEIVLPAVIRARQLQGIPVPVDGKVATFYVEVGDEVYEGQLLAEIRSQATEATRQAATLDLEQAQTRVNNLEASVTASRLEASRAVADAARVRGELDRSTREFTRQKLLLAEGATPRLVYEKAERENKALESEWNTISAVAKAADERVSSLQEELDRQRKLLEGKTADLEAAEGKAAAGQVTSPVGGIVVARRGQAGDEVHPAMEDLFQIATDLSTLDAELEPNAAQLARIRTGQAAGVIVADLPNDVLSGIVKTIENGKVTIEFANPSPLIKPGMTAQVRIKIQ